MATHDYVIANQSGAAFRTDLNNALAAIVSNNSNSSQPATRYAYQWWADTSAGVMKIRNSANDGWIELFQLDGTLTLEDGSASTPALAFRDDLNTGIFSSAADTFDIATGGVGRISVTTTGMSINDSGADFDIRAEGSGNANLFYLDAGNNRIGIGTNTPAAFFTILTDTDGTTDLILLHADANGSNNGIASIKFAGNTGNHAAFIKGGHTTGGDSVLLFFTDDHTSGYAPTERMRLSSAGEMLLGCTASLAVGGAAASLFEIETTSENAISCVAHRGTNTSGSIIILAKSRGTAAGAVTVVADNDELGALRFAGADGTDITCRAAEISCEVDGTPGSNDLPGRLSFKTTPDGSNVPTERMTLDSVGLLKVKSTTNGTVDLLELHADTDGSNNGVASLKFTGNAGNHAAFIQGGHETGGNTNLIFLTDDHDGPGKNPLERLRIRNDGALYAQMTSASQAHLTLKKASSAGDSPDFLQCRNNANSLHAVIEPDGDLKNLNNSYGQVSDIKLKENIVDANSQWDDIKAIKVRNFKFKESTGFSTHTQIGVVAQELETSSPNLVYESIDRDPATGEDLETRTKNVRYSVMYMKAIKCLQEAMTKIETLETKVAALESA